MAFVINLHLRSETQQRIAVCPTVGFEVDDPQQQRIALFQHAFAQCHQIAVNLGDQRGDGCLRPDHQVAVPVPIGHRHVQILGRHQHLGQPFLFLRNRSLHDGDRYLVTGIRSPLNTPEQGGGRPEHNDYRSAEYFLAPLAQQHGEQAAANHRHGQADPVYTQYRRQRAQPGIGLAVSQAQPRKAGQKPATPPLHQNPGEGQSDQPAERTTLQSPADDQVTEQCVIQAHDRDQPKHQQQSQRQRRFPQDMDRVVKPVGAREE